MINIGIRIGRPLRGRGGAPAPSDTTAPVLTGATDSATGQTTASLSVSTNEGNGTLYWFVSTSSTPPSATALKAGTGAVAYGSKAVTTTGVQSVSASGLTASTAYFAHFLHRDAAGNESAIVSGDGFTTEAATPSDPIVAMFSSGVQGIYINPSDAATVFQDAAGTTPAANGQPLGQLRDKSGRGNHLLQDTLSSKPVLRQATGGRWYVEADGVDDWMRVAFPLTGPFTRISVVRTVAWQQPRRLFGSGSSTSNLAGLLRAVDTDPKLGMYSGSNGPNTGTGLPVGTVGVVTEVFDGVNSSCQVNNLTPSTGNPGAALPVGITIFADSSNLNPGRFDLFGLFMIDRLLTPSETTAVKAWAASLGGVTL